MARLDYPIKIRRSLVDTPCTNRWKVVKPWLVDNRDKQTKRERVIQGSELIYYSFHTYCHWIRKFGCRTKKHPFSLTFINYTIYLSKQKRKRLWQS